MKKIFTKIKVRYCETDQMGIVHHGSYINYFEHSRIEWIKKNGFSYADLPNMTPSTFDK